MPFALVSMAEQTQPSHPPWGWEFLPPTPLREPSQPRRERRFLEGLRDPQRPRRERRCRMGPQGEEAETVLHSQAQPQPEALRAALQHTTGSEEVEVLMMPPEGRTVEVSPTVVLWQVGAEALPD